ncbi:hypothetical protein SDC9_107296 [bioreactor metagenome]|uniref:Uncharacterized protein n=1 Tax=bioreactor metagenome TaxID=1076179 RepID=A0A645B4S6_9ZZZZ
MPNPVTAENTVGHQPGRQPLQPLERRPFRLIAKKTEMSVFRRSPAGKNRRHRAGGITELSFDFAAHREKIRSEMILLHQIPAQRIDEHIQFQLFAHFHFS